MGIPEPFFTEVPPTPALQYLLDGMIRVRRHLYVDPMVGDPWSCDPRRCQPRLGPNLCCKVQRRCPHLRNDQRCAIHPKKPLLCALFPLDLVQIGPSRLVTTPKNIDFFSSGWSRYDRDMLRCFEGEVTARRSMFEQQREVLARGLTEAELLAAERAISEALGVYPGDGV
jgi:Fe-S-cluster containining protein